jgi:hypothetical protein
MKLGHLRDSSVFSSLFANDSELDPVRFSVMAIMIPRLSAPGQPSPTPKSSRDYISASSASSYATSSSAFTYTLSPQQMSHPPPHPSSTEDQIKTKP